MKDYLMGHLWPLRVVERAKKPIFCNFCLIIFGSLLTAQSVRAESLSISCGASLGGGRISNPRSAASLFTLFSI
jgi:hypothetical protein